MLLRSLFPLILTTTIIGELEMDLLQLLADGGGVLVVRKSQLSTTGSSSVKLHWSFSLVWLHFIE